ncbi:MAG TPA: helix-turn-helix domain-containing protein [Bryobacteraceae bacterium]|nr:helix-turn-helix domain-containing protein [Bryobacteraceae bacterium]
MKQQFDVLVEHLLAGNIFMEEAIELLEKRMIESALAKSGGKQTATSKLLGIHRNTLQRKMVQYGLANGRRTRRKPPARVARGRRRKSPAA